MKDSNDEMRDEIRKLRRLTRQLSIVNVIVLAAALAAGFWIFAHQSGPKSTNSMPSAPAVSRLPSPIPAVREKSIAILPFQDLNHDPKNAYFADGVQREILARLTQVADLKVINAANVMQRRAALTRNPHDIGQQLGAAHLVEGSVRHAENRVRVHVQLIDAEKDRTIWAETYDQDLSDLFAVEREIAERIADQLEANLSSSEKAAIEEEPATYKP
jgi:TolB-like protein